MASGATIVVFTAQCNEPPAAAAALFSYRTDRIVLVFDNGADSEAVFSTVLPRVYSGGGITAYIHFFTTVASGNVVWQGAFERIGEVQSADASGFASFVGSGTVAISSATNAKIATITFTDGAEIDSLVVGEGFRFKLRRDVDDTSATDSMAGNAQVFLIELKET